jgi:hypothetical protein
VSVDFLLYQPSAGLVSYTFDPDIAIDPLDKPICGQEKRWIDSNPNTMYYTGNTFKEFGNIDWHTMIQTDKQVDPSKILVYFDYHRKVYRFPTMMKHGFGHVLLEDNCKVGEGKNAILDSKNTQMSKPNVLQG